MVIGMLPLVTYRCEINKIIKKLDKDWNHTQITLFSEYHYMRRLQQIKVFILLVGIQVVRHLTQQQSPNTKTEIGNTLVTWRKLESIMVQLPLEILQWLLVVEPMQHRTCILKLKPKSDLCHMSYMTLFLSMITELRELDSFKNQIINRTLSTNYIMPGLFLVDIGFCSQNWARNSCQEWNTMCIS